VAEFTIGFAIAYDWMYEAWTAEQSKQHSQTSYHKPIEEDYVKN
jgi:hypothetical protein